MTNDQTEFITFHCLEVEQPIGSFYIGVMEAKELLQIAYADIRHLENRELDQYLGIERDLDDRRVEEIKSYVRTIDATFPSSIILAVKPSDVVFSDEHKAMAIRRQDSVGRILDGQHRIAGLRGLYDRKFQVPVTLFVDIDMEQQAQIFATINRAQTKVNRSLVYDLYAYQKSRSPQKSCHNIARLMNRSEGSPFQEKIKVLGKATPGRKGELLTQAAFVDRLIAFISDDPPLDRDLLKRGKKIDAAPPHRRSQLFLREMFREERDQEIALVVWNYFTAARDRWPEAWRETERGFILNRSTGFAGLMRFLQYAYNSYQQPNAAPPHAFFKAVFDKITLTDADFTSDRFKPGGSGEAALARDLLAQSGIPGLGARE